MKLSRLGLATLVAAAGPLLAQDFSPPPANAPDAATAKAIAEKTDKLGQRLRALRRDNVREPYLAEAEVFHKAAVWITRHNEFFQKEAPAWALEVLDAGLLRASQLAQGESPWLNQTGRGVARAYRSRLDGSVQPYAVALPADYGTDPRKKWRLDVVLHGRDASLTEVKFLRQHNAGRDVPKGQDFVQLDVFGRGNNAYRWAGEADVYEAIDNFLATERLLGRDAMIDPRRVVLRGFSMGGAGTWHLGLHRPDRWCVLGPGAGFTTTRGYVKNLPEQLPPHQEACLHVYDAVDYAENAFNVPVVAYSGTDDPQRQAAVNIEERLKKFGIPMTHLEAPGLGHQFPPEWRKKAEAEYAKHAAKGRSEYPPHVVFGTYTLKYPSCDWVTLLGLECHYQQARVEAKWADGGFAVGTKNVRALHLALPRGPVTGRPVRVQIDGQVVPARPYPDAAGGPGVYLERRDGRWADVLPERLLTDRQRRPQKTSGRQGPIDDAFTDAFLCVRGTGKPWHEATQKYAQTALEQFRAEWNKYLRGELPVKDDTEVTPQDVATKHLILFGDPASNALIGQCLGGLPLTWSKESVVVAGQTFAAAEHVPVLIYPSPLNNERYVVLNSGYTFGAAEFKGTNALLYPRLGDFAVLRPAADNKGTPAAEVKGAGLFDEFWQFPKK